MFNDRLEKYREAYLEKQKRKTQRVDVKMQIEMGIVPEVLLYSHIEIRGFRVDYKGVTYTCLNNLKLHGDLVSRND